MGRMRRKRTQVPDLGQGCLALVHSEQPVATERPGGRTRFLDDSAHHLRLGAERLDEYLTARGLKWVVDLRRELERVDYTGLLVRYESSGRKPYHPRTILGLIIYGMLCRQWSLRDLEDLAVRDVGAWWICGGRQPDHSTIGDFFERHREVLSEEFFVALVKDLVGRVKLPAGVVAGDGTVVEAAASHHRALTVEAAQQAAERARTRALAAPQDARRQQALAQTEKVAAVARARTERRQAKARPGGPALVAASEPEAVVQPRKDGARRPSYKGSILVHEKGLIVAQALHPCSETAVLEPMLDQHREIFTTEPASLLLDAGYNACEPLQMAVARNIDLLCPSGRSDTNWERKSTEIFGKNAFTYAAQQDVYHCPGGHSLRRIKTAVDRDQRAYRLYGGAPCANCALRQRCTRSRTGRTLNRYDGEEFKDAMAEVMRQPAARRKFRCRRIVERPFAEFRMRHGFTRFHRRGPAGARLEFALHCIAFNLKWAVSHRGADSPVIFCALICSSRERVLHISATVFVITRGIAVGSGA